MKIPDIPEDILARVAELESREVWPKPEPIRHTTSDVLPLTRDMLPKGLTGWITDVADRMQCPVDYVAVGAVVAASSIIGTGCAVLPKARDNWSVVPNVWGGVIGDPGALKTPALMEALAPLSQLERQARADHGTEMIRHSTDVLIYKTQRDLLSQQIAATIKAQARGKSGAGSATGSPQNVAQLKAQLLALQPPEEPRLPRYRSNDTTVEKLLELLRDNPRGLLVFRDELSGWLAQLDREDKAGDRAFYLEAWNGQGSYTSDRIQRGTTHADSVCVSILGGIQPGKLEAYLTAAIQGFENDGLVQRLQLLVYPDPVADWKLVDRSPDLVAQQRAIDLVTSLATADFVAFGATQDACRSLIFASVGGPRICSIGGCRDCRRG